MRTLSAASLKAESGKTTPWLPNVNRHWLTGTGFAIAMAMLVLVGAISYNSAQNAHQRSLWVAHTQDVLHALQELQTVITEAETGQRGYAVTGRDEYIEPFQRAQRVIPQSFSTLRTLMADNSAQLERLERLRRFTQEKMDLLAQTPDLRLDAEKMRKVIDSGVGKRLMDQIRGELVAMSTIERELLRQRAQESEDSAAFTKIVIVAGFLLSMLLLLAIYILLRREISQRAQAQAQVSALNTDLERHARQLEVSNRELEGFSYSVSHDLRIPLRAVAGYAQILEEDAGPALGEEGRRLLGVVRSNAAVMNQLIDDLLAFSRLGKQSLHVAPLDMSQLAGDAVSQCTEARLAEIAVQRDGDGEGTPPAQRPQVLIQPLPTARGDANLLRHVWINLISNAFKYSSARPQAHVEVGGHVQGSEAIYYVKDNGIGFDMRYAGKLFGVFQRLHGSDEYQGTGVGLAIVQRVIARHGGRVWAEAKPDEGATFSFALPLYPEQYVEQAQGTETQGAQDGRSAGN